MKIFSYSSLLLKIIALTIVYESAYAYDINNLLFDANQLIEEKRFLEGQQNLVHALIDDRFKTTNDQMRMLNYLADFYEVKVGNGEESLRYSERILEVAKNSQIDKNDEQFQQAISRIQRIKEDYKIHEIVYSQLDQYLGMGDGESLSGQSKTELLEKWCLENQAVHRKWEAKFELAKSLVANGENIKGLLLIRGILKARPAFMMSYPIMRFYEDSYHHFLLNCFKNVILSFITLSIMLLCIIIFFQRKRWCQHFKKIVVLFSFYALFSVIFIFLLGSLHFDRMGTLEGGPPSPVFISNLFELAASPWRNSFLAYISFSLLFSFLVGIVGMLHHHKRLSFYFGVVLMTFGFSGSMFGLFYLMHGRYDGVFVADSRAHLGYLQGGLLFQSNDVRPYVLLDPLKYPGLHLENLDEPLMRNFLKKYQKAQKLQQTEQVLQNKTNKNNKNE